MEFELHQPGSFSRMCCACRNGIVRRLLPMECGRLQGFPDGWGEIAPLANETEIQFWREVYLRNCKIKGQKPKKIIARADGARSDAAVKKWHDELHSPSAEYSMWGNGHGLAECPVLRPKCFPGIGEACGGGEAGQPVRWKRDHAAVCRDVRRAGCVGKRSGALPDCCYQDTPAGDATPRQHNGHQRRSDRAGGHHHFGSPCQDLSIAGKRKGLGGDRSCLFYEAIRVIREMLSATGGRYPRFVIWENVPGALSSHGGKDFEIVLNELLAPPRFCRRWNR